MEKQMKEETTMEENKKKNPDSERKSKLVSAILMAFVCVVMMGGGTYAWFTMSNTAKVTSLKLNVASEGNLYISKADDCATTKKSEVSWLEGNETIKTLYPCTSTDGKTMKKPIYLSETEVNNAEVIPEPTVGDTNPEKALYCLEQEFYLYLYEGDNVSPNRVYNVHLAQKQGSGNNLDGTYFVTGEGDQEVFRPEYCARVSFEVDGNVVAVYEPNHGATNTGKTGYGFASDSVNRAVNSTHVQSDSGAFTNDPSAMMKPLVSGDSDGLFTIKGNTSKKVVMRVWFEGTDDDCCNKIDLGKLQAQFKFVANKTTTTTTTDTDNSSLAITTP